MTRDVIKVNVSTDREEVAKIVERYDLLAVPVVDEEDRHHWYYNSLMMLLMS